MTKSLAKSQSRCSHNGQRGYDRDDDRDNAGVSIRFLGVDHALMPKRCFGR